MEPAEHVQVPSPRVFSALLSGNVEALKGCPEQDLRPFLPCLSRIALCAPTDTSDAWQASRLLVHSLVIGIAETNDIRELLSVDFQELKQDAKKEQRLLRKLGPAEERGASQSVLAASLQESLAIEFERGDAARKMRLLLSEILRIMNQACHLR